MKKLLLLLITGIFLINLVSASVIWNMPSNVKTISNFDINFYGSGLYALEINIPNGFTIVSDSSNGVLSNGVYRTTYASSLKITLRSPSIEKNYVFSGSYTEGSGVQSFLSKTLTIYKPSYTPPPSCPTCPSEGSWSNCEQGIQIRTIYECSSSTNYVCISKQESRACEMPKETCEVKEVCEGTTLKYQSSDCSTSTIQKCEFGCENGKCKENPNPPEINNTQPIPDSDEQPQKENVFVRIINWIKSIFERIFS